MVRAIPFLFAFYVSIFFSFSSHAKVNLVSLSALGRGQVKRLSRAVSLITTPKILSPVKALDFLSFDIGVDNSVLRVDDTDLLSNVDSTYYVPTILVRMGLPWNLSWENSVLIGSSNVYSVATGLNWTLLDEETFFVSIGLRSLWARLKFSRYSSHSWDNDLILSKAIWGDENPLHLYLGSALVKIWGTYETTVTLAASQSRHVNPLGWKLFGGIQKSLWKTLDSAVEVNIMQRAQSYSLKLSLII